jgi:hypothetical protein
MILETALSISLSINNHIKCDQFNKYNTAQITMESIECYQFTTKDINMNPYDYIKTQNQQLLDKQLIKSFDSDNGLFQDEEDKK